MTNALGISTAIAVAVRAVYTPVPRSEPLSLGLDVLQLLLFVALTVSLVRPALAALEPSEGRWLLVIAVSALAARLVAAVALHAYGLAVSPRAIAFDDESSYDFAARELVGVLTRSGELASEWWHLEGHQLSLLGALYTFVGPQPLVARVAGALLGASAAVLAALAARALFGRPAGLAAGAVVGLAPSLVVWSATLLKEPLVTALIALVFWAVARWRVAPSWHMAVLVLAALQVLLSVRAYAAAALAVLVAVALAGSLIGPALRTRPSHWRPVGVGVAVLAVAGVAWLVAPTILSLTDPVRLVYYQTVIRLVPPPAELLPSDLPPADRVGGVVGGPIVVVDVAPGRQTSGMIIGRQGPDDVFVALDREQVVLVPRAQVAPVQQMRADQAHRQLLEDLPRGLVAAALAPLTAPLTSAVHAALALDALFWLGLLALALVAAVRTREPLVLLPLAFTALMLAAQAVAGGNVGNLVRQRAILGLPGLILVAAPVLALLFAWVLKRVSLAEPVRRGADAALSDATAR